MLIFKTLWIALAAWAFIECLYCIFVEKDDDRDV